MRFTTRELVILTVFGTLWGVVEISLGSLLHLLHLPMSGPWLAASGLAIAIPLVMSITSVNLRIRKMEDLVGAGMTRFFQVYREVVPFSKGSAKMKPRTEPAQTG